MTFTDAAAEVLRLVGKPLHYKEITDIAIEKNLLSHVGKSPEVTMGARLAATLKKDSSENPLVRVKPGVFALREWDEKTIKAGLESKKGSKKASPGGRTLDARAESPAPKGRPKAGDDDEVLIGGAEDEEAIEESLEETEDAAPQALDLDELEREEQAEEAEEEAQAPAEIKEIAPPPPPAPAPAIAAPRTHAARVLDDDEDGE